MGHNNLRSVNREPAQSVGFRGAPTYAGMVSLHAHSRTTQQGNSYTQKSPTHKASHQPPTAPKPRSPPHLRPARTMTREHETGCSSEEDAFSPGRHDAALRRALEDRHYTAYNQAHAYILGVGRWNRSHLVQKHASNPVFETQEMYSDNSHGYRRERNRYASERNKIGFYNCDEFNHVQRNCRFDHKLLCGNCHRLGHKSRLCQQYRA